FRAAQIVCRERCVTKASTCILPGIRPCELCDKLVEHERCAGIFVPREGTRKLAGRRNITVRVRNQLNRGGCLIQFASVDLDFCYRGKRPLLLMLKTGGDRVTGRLMQALPRLGAGQASQGVSAAPPGVFVPAEGVVVSDDHGLLQQTGCPFTLTG